MNTFEKVSGFLKDNRMHPDDLDLKEQLALYEAEMTAGLSGARSSLLMLPTFITAEGKVPQDEKVIAIDAGGTNLRVALVHFAKSGAAVIESFENYPMPGTAGSVTFDEMCDLIAGYILPLTEFSDRIGYCFSHPAEIMPNCDGKVVEVRKEVKVENCAGRLLWEGLRDSLRKLGVVKPMRCVVLNDTVATMLGAIATFPDRRFDSYMGLILGTGCNTCYIEKNSNITKLKTPLLTGSMIVNEESGGYGKLTQGTVDYQIDRSSRQVGEMQLEKQLSGVYLGKVMFETSGLAARNGLFSEAFAEKLANSAEFTLRQVDEFCFSTCGDNALAALTTHSDDDRRTLYGIIDLCYERAAKIVALQIGATAKKCGYGADPTVPLCVSAEGTTFYKAKLLRPKLDYWVRCFIEDRLGLHVEFVKAENSTITGSAVAGLLN